MYYQKYQTFIYSQNQFQGIKLPVKYSFKCIGFWTKSVKTTKINKKVHDGKVKTKTLTMTKLFLII